MDSLYGPQAVRDRVADASADIDFEHAVQPIFNRRCLVCHACYDAPCQLKMENFSGPRSRREHRSPVYDSARLLEAPPTRLGDRRADDAAMARQGILSGAERARSDAAEQPARERAVQHARAEGAQSAAAAACCPTACSTFRCDRAQSCATLEEMPKYEKRTPAMGYAVRYAGADVRRNDAVSRSGCRPAPRHVCRRRCPSRISAASNEWEAFFNGASLKAQLMSRYMYEHLFLADIYFDEVGTGEHFRLVRSTTPPGQPIDIIATRRPYDDPGVARPYYRLQRNTRDAGVEDAHGVCAEREAHADAGRHCSWTPDYTVDRTAGLQDGRCVQSVPDVPGDSGEEPLSVHDRRSAVHDHGFHQGPGVPRTDRARRHRGSVLGVVHRSRCRSDDARRRIPRVATEGSAAAGLGRQHHSRLLHWVQLLEDGEGLSGGESRARTADVSERPQADARHDLGRRRR